MLLFFEKTLFRLPKKMGVEYFNCSHCKGVTCDVSSNVTFDIQNWDEQYVVCPDCVKSVYKMLKLANPLPYYCFMENRHTKQRSVFRRITDLKSEWGKMDQKESDFEFGLRKSKDEWKEWARDAFIGQGACGGMSNDEIKQALIDMMKTPHQQVVYIGWRHEVVKTFSIASVETMLSNISYYETCHHLQGVPKLIAAYGSALPHHPRDLDAFCFPNASCSFITCDSISQLEIELNDAKNVIGGHFEWTATADFVEFHRKFLQNKKQRLKRKIAALDEIEKNFLQHDDPCHSSEE